MTETVGWASLQIIPSLRGFESKLNGQVSAPAANVGRKAGESMGGRMRQGVLGSFKNIAGPMAAAMGGAAIAKGLSSSITAASDLGETMSKSSQVFGKQAMPALDKFAKGAATSLGQSRQQALDAAATFGVFGKSAGLEGSGLTKFSTKLTSLSSDLASFGNTSPQEAIDALGSALRGEAEPIRKYGVLLDDASLRQEALKLGLTKTTKEALTPQQKILAAQSAIYKQTKDAQGDFARTSGGLANQQRILAARFNNVKVTIGEALLPIATRAVTLFNSKVVPAFEAVRKVVADNLPAVRALIDRGFKVIAPILTADLIPALQSMLQGVRDNLPAIRAFIDRGLSIAGRIITNVVVPALTGLFAGLVAVGRAAVSTAGWLSRHTGVAKTVAAAIVGFLLPAYVAAKVAAIRTGIAAMTSAVMQGKAWLMVRVEAIKSLGMHLRTAAVMVGRWVFMGVQSLIQAGKMAAAWVIAMGPIALVIAAVVGVAALIITNWDKIVRKTRETWEAVSTWMRDKAEAARDAVTRKITSLIDWFRGVPDRILKALGDLGELLLDAGRNVVNGLLRGIREKIGDVGETIRGAFDIDLPSIRLPWTGEGDGPGRLPSGTAGARAAQAAAGLPVTMSSSYRTPARNAAVGGSPTSFHLDAANPATDWIGPTWALDEFARRLRGMGPWREGPLWRVPNHAPGDNPHVHVADKGGVFKGPGHVWMGRGQETFAFGVQAAEKVADLPTRRGPADRPVLHIEHYEAGNQDPMHIAAELAWRAR